MATTHSLPRHKQRAKSPGAIEKMRRDDVRRAKLGPEESIAACRHSLRRRGSRGNR